MKKLLSLVLFTTHCLLTRADEVPIWTERREPFKEANSGNNKTLQILNREGSSHSLPNVSPINLFRPSYHTPNSALHHPLLKSLLHTLSVQHGFIRKVSIPQTPIKEPVVIHIQDIHMNLEAQENIGKTIRELMVKQQVDLVALEGAFAAINLTPFQRFPHQDTILKVADYLLRENKISGPIHTLLTAHSKLKIPSIIGVDDRPHYKNNVEAYRRSVPLIKPCKKQMAKLTASLAEQKRKIYSPNLLAFDQKVESYREGRLSLGNYIQTLKSQIAEHKLQNGSPVSSSFLSALSLESSLNFAQVEKDRFHLLSKLLAKLDKNQTSAFMELSHSFRKGNLRQFEFYEYLESLCAQKKISLAQFPALDAYLQYIHLSENLNSEKLFLEIREMEEGIYKTLTKLEEEKNLVRESRRLCFMWKLLDFALTPEEWGEYKQIRGTLPIDLDSFEAFYEEAEFRDKAMAKNLLKAMDQKKSKVVVLVTGGFHTSGINENMNQAGIATITYVPKISNVDNENGTSYLSVFTQEKTPIEKLFEGEEL